MISQTEFVISLNEIEISLSNNTDVTNSEINFLTAAHMFLYIIV